jgi:long-chain acyl-CoA synthetase
VQSYGLTDCAGVIAHLEPRFHDPVNRPELLRSYGRPLPWIDIKIVERDIHKEMERDRAGELWTRSVQNMAGSLHDRIKDMIVSGGENIYPAAVEFREGLPRNPSGKLLKRELHTSRRSETSAGSPVK